MNLVFTSSFALASALLPLGSVAGANNKNNNNNDANIELTNLVASSYHQEKDDNDHAATRRLSERLIRSAPRADGDPTAAAAFDGSALLSDPDLGIFPGRNKNNKGGNRRRGRKGILFPRKNNNNNNDNRSANNDGIVPPRFLQQSGDDDDDASQYACDNQDACPPALCECVSAGGQAVECAAELHGLCQQTAGKNQFGETFSVDTCVSSPRYYDEAYCPFVACLVGGTTFETCDCAFYDTACELYENDPDYNDDADVIQNCAADACCKTKTTDEGRGMCFEGAPSSRPSAMPTSPTPPPTPRPTVEGESLTAPPSANSVESGETVSGDDPGGAASDGSPPDSPPDGAGVDSSASDEQTAGTQGEDAPAPDAKGAEKQAPEEQPDDEKDPSKKAPKPKATLSGAQSIGVLGSSASFAVAAAVWYVLA